MTALNAWKAPGAVHLLTDGAAVGVRGDVLAIWPKVVALPHLSCVVAARGHADLSRVVATLAGTLPISTFADMVEAFPDLVSKAAAHIRSDGVQAMTLNVVLAGLDGETPRIFLAEAEPAAAVWSLSVREVGAVMSPSDGSEPGTTSEALVAGDGLSFDAARDGVPLMERQRDLAGNGVGAFVQLTTVTSDGISTRILHRWPDKVGDAGTGGKET